MEVELTPTLLSPRTVVFFVFAPSNSLRWDSFILRVLGVHGVLWWPGHCGSLPRGQNFPGMTLVDLKTIAHTYKPWSDAQAECGMARQVDYSTSQKTSPVGAMGLLPQVTWLGLELQK